MSVLKYGNCSLVATFSKLAPGSKAGNERGALSVSKLAGRSSGASHKWCYKTDVNPKNTEGVEP